MLVFLLVLMYLQLYCVMAVVLTVASPVVSGGKVELICNVILLAQDILNVKTTNTCIKSLHIRPCVM